jgi:soluble lytic murein transglycosylase-like protein
VIRVRIFIKISHGPKSLHSGQPASLWKPGAFAACSLLALVLGPPRLNQQALVAGIGLLAPKSYSASLIKPGCAPLDPSTLEPLIDTIAVREGVEPALLWTIILRESGFQPCAVSRTGARGLMQLMPATAEQLGVRDPFNPEENLAAGARFFGMLLRRYRGDVRLALGAYYIGPGAVDDLKGAPFSPAAHRYISDILRLRVLFQPRARSSS